MAAPTTRFALLPDLMSQPAPYRRTTQPLNLNTYIHGVLTNIFHRFAKTAGAFYTIIDSGSPSHPEVHSTRAPIQICDCAGPRSVTPPLPPSLGVTCQWANRGGDAQTPTIVPKAGPMQGVMLTLPGVDVAAAIRRRRPAAGPAQRPTRRHIVWVAASSKTRNFTSSQPPEKRDAAFAVLKGMLEDLKKEGGGPTPASTSSVNAPADKGPRGPPAGRSPQASAAPASGPGSLAEQPVRVQTTRRNRGGKEVRRPSLPCVRGGEEFGIFCHTCPPLDETSSTPL